LIEVEAEEQAERGWGRDAVPSDQIGQGNSLGRAGARQRSLDADVLRIKKY